MMAEDILQRIEEWFAQADGGEFGQCELTAPFKVVGPSPDGADTVFVYSTKTHCVTMTKWEHREFDRLGFIGQYGLPRAEHVAWIRRVLDGRRMLFLGDMDPVDLMTFAWWRATLAPRQVAFLGVGDGYLDRLGIEIPEHYMIPLAADELRAMPVLEERQLRVALSCVALPPWRSQGLQWQRRWGSERRRRARDSSN